MTTQTAKTSTFFVAWPQKRVIKMASVVNPLTWWNTHFKRQHLFDAGRIEVRFERALRNFDQLQKLEDEAAKREQRTRLRKHVTFACPHCKKLVWFEVDHINKEKGHLKCWGCKKEYGVHPSGQVFMPMDVNIKEVHKQEDREKVLRWLRHEAHYEDWELSEGSDGVSVQVSAPNEKKLERVVEELRAELSSRGLKFREGE